MGMVLLLATVSLVFFLAFSPAPFLLLFLFCFVLFVVVCVRVCAVK